MQDLKALEGKSLAELREIGKALGIPLLMMKKKDLIEKILNFTQDGGVADTETPTKPRRSSQENPSAAYCQDGIHSGLRRNTGATRRTDHDDTDSRSDKRER